MTRTIGKLLIFIFIMSVLAIPAFSLAAQDPVRGLVPCNNTPDANGEVAEPCDFKALMNLVNKVVNFVLFVMAVPISAIMFAYAGFLMVTSGGSTEQRGKAKKVFTNVALGLIIAVAAWLIINTILSILGYDGDWIGF